MPDRRDPLRSATIRAPCRPASLPRLIALPAPSSKRRANGLEQRFLSRDLGEALRLGVVEDADFECTSGSACSRD
ncbi:hypothetical protein [Micromonospora profundi]|uniref:hypothetical protein n=1 Tax=Micromonospora profundi TaxID=1420889 RepID=UPI003825986B